jgi:hypothetical protein
MLGQLINCPGQIFAGQAMAMRAPAEKEILFILWTDATG